MVAEVFALKGTVYVNQKEVNMQLKEIEKTARETGRVSEKELKRIERQNRATARAAQEMARKMISLAAKIAAALGAVRLGKGSLESFQTFEEQMKSVYTLLPGISGQAMKEMEDQTKSFAKELGILPQELIPSLYTAISSGVPEENVFSFLRSAHKAAVGGITDLSVTVDGLTSVVNAYGAEVIDQTRASDIFFQTMKIGKTDMAELSQSIYNVTPIASALGVTFEDVGAGLAAITAQGVPTATATTQMRQMFVELSKASSNTAKIFEEISGKSFKQFIAEGGNTQEALQLLEEYANKSNMGINDLFGSVQAGNAALALTGAGTAKFTEAIEAMANASGSTEDAYSTMAGTLNQAMKRIGANLSVLMIELGEKLEPMARAFADWLEENMPQIQEVASSLFNTIGSFIKWLVNNVFPPFVSALIFIKNNWIILAAAIGTAITVLIIPALKKMGIEAVATGKKFATAFGPLGVVLTVAAALIGAFVQAWQKDMGGIQEKTKSVFNIIGVWFKQLSNGISKIWNSLLKGWYDSILWIIDKAKPLINILPKSWQESIKGFEDKTRESSNKAGENLEDLKAKGIELADEMEGAKERIGSAFSSWETKTIETTESIGDASDSLVETWGGNTATIIEDIDSTIKSLDDLDKKASELEAKWRAKLEDQAVEGDALGKLELERRRAIAEAQKAGASITDIELYYANERAKILDELAKKRADIDLQIYEQQLKAVDDREKLQEIELEKELEKLRTQGATEEQLVRYRDARLQQIANEATKERKRLLEEEAQARQTIKENLRQWEIETEQLSLEEQLASTRQRLRNQEEGSNEWLRLKREELRLTKEIADKQEEASRKQIEAEQAIRDELIKQAQERKAIKENLRQWEIETEQISLEEQLASTRQRLRNQVEGSNEWLNLKREEAKLTKAIADQIAEAERKQTEAIQAEIDKRRGIKENLRQWEIETEQLSLEEQLASTRQRLRNQEEGSNEWLRLKREELRLTKEIADQIAEVDKAQSEAIQRERDERRKVIENIRVWQLQTGERTKQEELAGIRQRLKSQKEGSDEWLRLKQEESTLIDEINAEKLSKEQAYYELLKQFGQVNYADEAQKALDIYTSETASYEDRLSALADFYNIYKKELEEATDKEKAEIIERLQAQLAALDETEEAYKELSEAIQKLMEEANRPLIDWTENITDSIENVFKSSIDTMTKAWSEGLGVWKGMLRGFGTFVSGVFKPVFDGLVAEMAKVLIAQNSWVIASLANIAAVVSGYIAQAFAALTAFYWFLGPGAPAAAGATIAVALAAIAALGIKVSQALGLSTPKTEGPNAKDSPKGKGTQISEITGASRDLLVTSLAPLASLDSLVGIGERIYSKLAEIGDALLLTEGLLSGNLSTLSGVGGINVNIGDVTLTGVEGTTAGVADALVDMIDEKLSRRWSIAQRGGGRR